MKHTDRQRILRNAATMNRRDAESLREEAETEAGKAWQAEQGFDANYLNRLADRADDRADLLEGQARTLRERYKNG